MRKTTAQDLAMRDPAMAALVGGLDASDFGSDWNFGEETDYDISDKNCSGTADANIGGEFGWDDAIHGNASYARSRGATFGDDAMPGVGPTPQQALQAWHQQNQMAKETDARHSLLYPNKNSHIKIEGYEFALSQTLVLGTAAAVTMTDTPSTELRPRRVSMNAPSPGFVTFTQLQVSNVNTLVGGTSDAFFYNANGTGQGVSYPTLTPSTKAQFSGSYSGMTPPGFVQGSNFLFVVEFKGPASITA